MDFSDQHKIPMFVMPNGQPWPRGTAIALVPFPQHSGFIDYTISSEQIMIHKTLSGAVVTWPEEFNDKGCAYRALRVPGYSAEADAWLDVAYEAVERGDPWTGLDNCQDFVWEAITNRKHSPTRDGLIFAAAVVGIIGMLGSD